MTTNSLREFDGILMQGLEFCAKVYSLFETVRTAPDGASRLRLRSSRIEKKLLEELLPICRYIQSSYRPGRYLSVRWVDGNQLYDAELHQRGAYVNEACHPAEAYLEVTCVMHPKEHMSRELLEKKGVAFGLEGIRRLKNGEIESTPVGHTNRNFIAKYKTLVLKELSKKAKKSYPANTTLIVQCTLNTVYMADEWEELMNEVAISLPRLAFREVYFYDPVSYHSRTILPRDEA